MSELIKQEETAVANAEQDYGELSFAQRVALDPSVDIERLQKIIDMEAKTQDREAEKIFNQALAEMQPELPAVGAFGEGHQGAKYGKLEHIQQAIRPALHGHGFAVRFKVHDSEDALTVECILSHRDGHSDSDKITLPYDTSGSKNAVQARGSTVSYGKRYTLCNILNIQVGGQDDDARLAAPQVELISPDQVLEMHAFITENRLDLKAFMGWANVKKLEEIHAANFEKGMTALRNKVSS